MKKILIFSFFLIGCAQPDSAPAPYDGPKTKVLMIGDSVSIGYTPYVRQDLNADMYEVIQYVQPNGQIINAGNSTNTLLYVRQWIADACPDCSIIVWNNGIWDSMRADKSEALGNAWVYHNDDATYVSNIAQIAQILKENNRRVIFMTSTDVPAAEADTFDYFRIPDLNSLAVQTLTPLGIEIYDLNAVSETMTDQHDGVTPHWLPSANAVLGQRVADKISNHADTPDQIIPNIRGF